MEICIDQTDTTDANTSGSDRSGTDTSGSNQSDIDASKSDHSSVNTPASDQPDIESNESDIEAPTDELSVDMDTDQSDFDSTATSEWQHPTLSDVADARINIYVDQLTQLMTVYVDGVKRYTWKVSTGKAGYWTPNGQFTPLRMEAEYFSREWDDAPMPHSIFFTPRGHAIHGSIHTARLGTAASHGCVRLSPENAAMLYALVEKEGMDNTKVTIVHEIPVTGPYEQTKREAHTRGIGSNIRTAKPKVGSFWLRNRRW